MEKVISNRFSGGRGLGGDGGVRRGKNGPPKSGFFAF